MGSDNHAFGCGGNGIFDEAGVVFLPLLRRGAERACSRFIRSAGFIRCDSACRAALNFGAISAATVLNALNDFSQRVDIGIFVTMTNFCLFDLCGGTLSQHPNAFQNFVEVTHARYAAVSVHA